MTRFDKRENKDIVLKSGEIGKFSHYDDWQRPVWKADIKLTDERVVTFEIVSTEFEEPFHIHSLCGDEPDTPLKEKYQFDRYAKAV